MNEGIFVAFLIAGTLLTVYLAVRGYKKRAKLISEVERKCNRIEELANNLVGESNKRKENQKQDVIIEFTSQLSLAMGRYYLSKNVIQPFDVPESLSHSSYVQICSAWGIDSSQSKSTYGSAKFISGKTKSAKKRTSSQKNYNLANAM